MKTIFYTSTLILALCCGSDAVAQNTADKTKSCPDSVLLSKRVDGDYEVRQYLVKGKSPEEADFTIYFPINSSKMSAKFSDNPATMSALNEFAAKVNSDTLMRVKSVKIMGWASPDGTEAFNAKLAKSRASTFASYLMANCPEMKNFAVETSSMVATWSDCLPMIEESSVADKTAAADVINGNHTPTVKEQHLSKMPAVWNLLKGKILPQFRCVQVDFTYYRSTIVEKRVLIKKPVAPQPAATPAATTQPVAQKSPAATEQIQYMIIEDKRNGVIVEMGEVDVDFE